MVRAAVCEYFLQIDLFETFSATGSLIKWLQQLGWGRQKPGASGRGLGVWAIFCWLKAEQLGPEPAPIWDPGIAGGGLT